MTLLGLHYLMTKRRYPVVRLRRTLGLSGRALQKKKNSQNAGLQKPEPRTLDREMQKLELNRRVEQGKFPHKHN